ncbi:hypothetical protein LB506_005228 [Fusarium annulatum]|nr:hypothetical protein LB506_005228 [Fusarium annulatum]
MLKGVWKQHLVFIGSILCLRSGDSVVSAKLAERGYQRRLCVSFSPVVRQKEIEWIDWGKVSVRDMLLLIATGPVDVASDKGTLDTMIHGSPWSPHDEVMENTCKYPKEVHGWIFSRNNGSNNL